jgi:ribosomal protein S18
MLNENKLYLCRKCYDKKIYKTECHKKYKLNDDDLKDLPFGNTMYKNNICTYYFKPHVINLVENKYGTNYENIFEHQQNNKKIKQNTKKNLRENKIIKILTDNHIEYNEYKNMDLIKDFISNGKNLKTVTKYIREYDLRKKILNENLKKYKLKPDYYYCDLYINQNYPDDESLFDKSIKICSNIDNLISKLLDMRRRRLLLEIKLFINNLELRNDSKICLDYIDGESKNELDEIVKIMKQMKFLYEKTDYPNILKQTRYEYICMQRQFGWYEHDDENEEEVRYIAKEKAFSQYKKEYKKVPTFDDIL